MFIYIYIYICIATFFHMGIWLQFHQLRFQKPRTDLAAFFVRGFDYNFTNYISENTKESS